MVGALAASPLPAAPQGYAINSAGNFTDDSLVFALWRVDLATGQETYVGQTALQGFYLDVEGLAFNAEEELFGADDDTKTLLRINPNNGNGIPVGGARHNLDVPEGQPMDFGMTFTCDGELLVSSDVRESLYRADQESGELTLIGTEGSLGAPITDLAAWGDQTYGIGQGSHRPSGNGPDQPDAPNLYRVDVEQASAELVGGLGSAVGLYHNAGLAFDDEGVLWALTNRRDINGQDLPSQVLRIDPETGVAEMVAETIVGFESLAITVPGGCDGDPEPSGEDPLIVPALGAPGLAALAGLILMLTGWRLRRRT